MNLAEPLTPASSIDAENRNLGRLPSVLMRSLIAVLVGSLILRLAAQVMNSMLGFYFDEINTNHYTLSFTTQGLIVSSFFVTELAGSPILGAMSDRYGRKLFILLGPLFGAVAVQITSMTVAIWLLVITRLLEGLSTAAAIPATLGYISEATTGRPALRARIIGLFEITLVGGLALGSIVGGYLWDMYGKPGSVLGLYLIAPAFSLNGVIYLISLAVFVWGLREVRRPPRELREGGPGKTLRHYLHTLRSPHVWRFVPAWLALNSIIGAWINHSARLMTEQSAAARGGQMLAGAFTPKQFGFGFAVLSVIFAAGVLGWSLSMGRYRRTSVMLIATGGLFMTLAAVYGLNHLSVFEGAGYYALVGLLVIGLAILSGFTPAALTYLADVTESHTADRGSIMGLYSVFLGIGQVIGSSAGGRFADWGRMDGMLLLSAILGLITALTLVFLRRHEARV